MLSTVAGDNLISDAQPQVVSGRYSESGLSFLFTSGRDVPIPGFWWYRYFGTIRYPGFDSTGTFGTFRYPNFRSTGSFGTFRYQEPVVPVLTVLFKTLKLLFF